MTKPQKDAMLVQGSILAFAGLFTKLLGFLYRIPMANFLGEQGNGIYSVAFGIYNIALTLSSYCLPSAVAKLVSERLGRGEPGGARAVFRLAVWFSLVAGLAAFGILFFGAAWLEGLYHRAGLARPLQVLAPTAFLVAVLGVLRGWFQGHGNMVPTAISQVLEQLVNVAVSLLAAWQFLRIYRGSPSHGAAGGTLGTLAGAAAALLFMVLLYRNSQRKRSDFSLRSESYGALTRALAMTVVPLILSQSIYQLGSTIDDLLFGSVMAARLVPDSLSSAILGVYNSQYNQLTTLPVAVTTAMAATVLPAIALMTAQGLQKEATAKIRTVLKLNMAVAIPSAVGLAVLAEPIMEVLYPSLTQYRNLSVRLMQTGSIAVVFYALSTITSAVLQGGGHMRTPVWHAGLSLAGHIILVWALLWYTRLDIYALILGNVTFPMVLALLNCRALRRTMRCRLDSYRTVFLPTLASVWMGLVAWGIYRGTAWLGWKTSHGLLAAIVLAMVTYAVLLLRFGCFSPRELEQLPFGSLLKQLAGVSRRKR